MTQFEQNACSSLIYNLPDIVKQLKIANKLKAIELKHNIDKSVKEPYEWTKAIDTALNS